MKLSNLKALTIIVTSMTLAANAFALNKSQRDTAIGAALGGVAGAMVGNDVTSTVAGAALGGVVGSQWNAHKREREEKERYDRYERKHREDRRGYDHRPSRHKVKYDDRRKWHKKSHKKKHWRHS